MIYELVNGPHKDKLPLPIPLLSMNPADALQDGDMDSELRDRTHRLIRFSEKASASFFGVYDCMICSKCSDLLENVTVKTK